MAVRDRKRCGSDEELIAALTVGRSFADAAAAAGISERTARRRAAEPEAREAVRERRQALASAHTGALLHAVELAIGTLTGLLNSESEGMRLRSASVIVAQAVSWRASVEFETRLEELEARNPPDRGDQ